MTGFHIDTHSIKQIVHKYVTDEMKDILTEEMLLGIGGGVGYGYFTFFYDKEDFSSMFLGTRASWESSADFFKDVFQSLGCDVVVKQSKDRRASFEQLDKNVSSDILTIIAISDDVFTENHISENGYQVYVVAEDLQREEGVAKVSHNFFGSVEIPIEDLILGRCQLATRKLINQAIHLKDPQPLIELNLAKVVEASKEGISTYLKHAHNPRMSNFGITALEKWEKLLTANNKQSWNQLFGAPKHFVNALYYTYYWIVHNTEGYAFRYKYATFLKKVGAMIDEPKLIEASKLFEDSGNRWRQIAEDALSDEVKEFSKIKELFLEREELKERGELTLQQYKRYAKDILELKAEAANEINPLEMERKALFKKLSDHVHQINQIEHKAIGLLEKSLESDRWEVFQKKQNVNN